MTDMRIEIKKIGAEIEKATREKHQAEGKRTSIIENMSSNFSITTKEGAEKEIKLMGKQLEKLAEKIEEKFKDLEENYSWE